MDVARKNRYANDSQLHVRLGMNAHVNPILAAQAAEAITPAERSAYRRSRGGDSIATLAALAVGTLTVGAFALIHPTFVAKQKRDHTVVALLSLPEDPPPAETPPPPEDAPPPKAEVAAPVPLVALMFSAVASKESRPA